MATVRSMNLTSVLTELIRAEGQISRAELATATGLTRMTISRFMDELTEAGMVTETVKPVRPGARGRPASCATVTPGRRFALGVEVNANSLTILAVDITGSIIARRVFVQGFAGEAARRAVSWALEQAEHVLAEVAARHPDSRLIGIGMALPGILGLDGAPEIINAPNLDWRREHLTTVAAFAADHGVELTIHNEATVASRGATMPTPVSIPQPASFIYLSGEVGLGGAIMVNGENYTGVNGRAGEIGHVCVNPDGPLCACGATGCLEVYLGPKGLRQRAGLGPTASADELITAWTNGDPAARAAVDTAGRALGLVLAATINLVDVPAVVVGGWLSPLTQILRIHVHRELVTRLVAFDPADIDFLAAGDGMLAAARGAALAVIADHITRPEDLIGTTAPPAGV